MHPRLLHEVKKPWWEMLSNKNWHSIEDHARGERIIVRAFYLFIAIWLVSIFVAGLSVPTECWVHHSWDNCLVVHRISTVVANTLTAIIALIFLYHVSR